MGNSKRKTKIFGNCNSTEKQDKRINNRMFRRREHTVSNEIEKELHTDNMLWYIEREISELDYPIDMNEIRNVWAMDKDGKSYWVDAPEKSMRK